MKVLLKFFALFFLMLTAANVSAATLTPAGAAGMHFSHPPQRVACLVPAVTEIIFAIGAGDALAGVTYHSTYPAAVAEKTVVGGFFAPSIERIGAVDPDLIIAADLHKEVRSHFPENHVLVDQPVHSIDQALARVESLGMIFAKEDAARKLIEKNRQELAIIAQKTGRIPAKERQRVMRLMGVAQLMAPGDDSFQNDFIRAAGGLPPHFGRNGNAITVSVKELKKFNPQCIYVCGDKAQAAVLANTELQAIDAVKNKRVFSFSCDLTCRAGAHIGAFVSALSARIYEKEFSDPARQLTPDHGIGSREVSLALGYVQQARVVESRVRDFIDKTLVIDFASPQRVLSTLEGERLGITSVGNHYYPPPAWGLGGNSSVAGLKTRSCAVLGKDPDATGLLFTGADMDNLVVSRKGFRDLEVYALVTAGVATNAMRMSVDTGNYYEPGTINIILLTNTRLSPQAMARSVISATEAKSAALADLDIRSTYTPQRQATGTGTDNILVVQGEGIAIDNSGGHTKMGELIARAVYDGVREAIARQNGITANRSIFARLKERRIDLREILPETLEDCSLGKAQLVAALENILLQPEYAGFMMGSFAISDTEQASSLTDLRGYAMWSRAVSNALAGHAVESWPRRFAAGQLPPVIALAFESLVNGVCAGKPGDGP
ncbi:MAG: adenosylcobinamide amidohydrolase [Proteobacteria bacterium]|nr:adenosylcobinamide amidohydrolase [Pseudomonadota bacterium]MCG2742063.1 adenosylcobinamide amidohydrolase [Syntrophaceae bacterium]